MGIPTPPLSQSPLSQLTKLPPSLSALSSPITENERYILYTYYTALLVNKDQLKKQLKVIPKNPYLTIQLQAIRTHLQALTKKIVQL